MLFGLIRWWPPNAAKSLILWILEVLEYRRKFLLSLARMCPLKMTYWKIRIWIPKYLNLGKCANLFNPNFRELDRLKSIVKYHGSILFQPFHEEGLRVSPLKLKVHPSASFWMQPCRFIRDGNLKPLKTMLDQFVSANFWLNCDSIGHCQKNMVDFAWWLITEK